MEQKFSLHEFLLQYVSLCNTSLVLLFFFSILYFIKSSSKILGISLPPSPPKLPIIGNLHQIGLFPHQSLWSLAKQYGPLMLLHFGNVPILVVSSADAAREILKTHDITFANRPKSVTSKKLLYDYKDLASAPYGEYWRQMRRMCVLHLLSSKRVQSFRQVREEETKVMIEKIKMLSSCSTLEVDLSEVLATFTNDIVCRVALGKKYTDGEEGKRFKKLLGEFGELLSAFHVGNFIPWLAWVGRLNGIDARMDRVAKELDDFIDLVVEEHIQRLDQSRKEEHQQDFVDILLWLQKENLVDIPMDRVSIKAIILDMFAAGTDTTYTATEWTMSELLRHPQVMKKVQDEVRKIAGNKSLITEEDINKLPYLKAVVRETLRVHPPVPILVPRESTQDVTINGYHIAAKTRVFVNAFAIGQDPLSWKQPEKFLPERFLNDNSDADVMGHHFELIPFGSGRRGCPGIYFAMAANEIALANLLCMFDWTLPGEANAESLDMSGTPGLTMHRKFPLTVIASAYRQ
ncbi:hypothetical protein ACFE04_031247 [Oxalis oulophora]